ncbi:MAG: O-antigen ligase family protein [Sphingorhabdus sp.]
MIARFLHHDWLLPGYLVLCIVLGGASAAGALANGLVQLLAVLLLAAMWFWDDRRKRYTFASAHRWFGYFILAVLLWTIIQIIPLPPNIWSNLPGREILTKSLEMFGNEADDWRSIALEPEYTLASALSFLPPLAVLGLGLKAERRSLHLAVYAVIGLAIFSTAIGIIQLLQGPSSPLYFYDISSKSTSTGFFANSNHLATLLLIAMIFSVSAIPGGSSLSRKNGTIAAGAFIWLATSIYLAFNLLVNRSLAGFGLAMIAIAYLLLMLWGSWRGRFPDGKKLILVIVAAMSLFPIVVIGLYDWLSEFVQQGTRPETRLLFNSLTWEAVKDFFPFGTGLGNFRWIYSGYETDAILQSNYVNHVHNDWHELLLQGGVFAILIVGLFLWALIRHLIADIVSERLLDKPERWAPYLALLMVLLHSIVDYPLRTSAIAGVTALCVVYILRTRRFNPHLLN